MIVLCWVGEEKDDWDDRNLGVWGWLRGGVGGGQDWKPVL
jgi:hypothetical protein